MKKRILATLLSLVLVVGLLPVTAGAADEGTTLYWYVVDEDEDETSEVLYITSDNVDGAQQTTDASKGWVTTENKNNIVKIIVGSEGHVVAPVRTSEWFNNFGNVTSIDLTYLDMSNVTSAYSMFCGCTKLKALDVRKWDVSKNKSFGFMFMGCESLEELDVSNWDTQSATSFNQTFKYCHSLSTLDLSKWNTANVTNMNEMFYNAKLKIYDLSAFTIKSTTNTTKLFHDFINNSVTTNHVIILGDGNEKSFPVNAHRVTKNSWEVITTIPEGAGIYSAKRPVTITYKPNGGTGSEFSEY